MKVKKLIKFYYRAEQAERAIDRLILRRAGVDFYRTAEACAERVIDLTEKKRQLKRLWNFLDGVMDGFTEEEQLILKYYAFSGTRGARREHALAVRFARKVSAGIAVCGEGLEVMVEYFIE